MEVEMTGNARRLVAFAAVVTALAALLLSRAAPASASVAAQTGGRAIAALPCWATPAPGVDAVSIRREPRVAAGNRIGIMAQGQSADAACSDVTGGFYADCGGGNLWTPVIWGGVRGYAALWCMTVWED
jgi:hypothetical protein